jgi:hypothetical protein
MEQETRVNPNKKVEATSGNKGDSAIDVKKVDAATEIDEMIDDELESTSIFHKYEINPKFIDLLKKEPCKGTITKVSFGKSESLVIATKILRWTKNISPRNQADRDYLAFKGVGKSFDATIGELIGFKSGKSYWGIRFHLTKDETMNYAFTLGDMRILCEMSVFKKV